MVSKFFIKNSCINKAKEKFISQKIIICRIKDMSTETSFITSSKNDKKRRGNRNQSPKSKYVQKQDDANSSFDVRNGTQKQSSKNMSKSETSFFSNDDQNEDDNQNGQEQQKISEKQENSDQDNELQPDKPPSLNKLMNQSIWDKADDAVEVKDQQQKTSARGRGNLTPGKKLNSSKTSDYGGNAPKINPDHQLPSEQSAPKRRGNRYPEEQRKNQGKDSGYQQKQNYNNNQRNYYNNRDQPYQRGYRGGYRGQNRGGNRNSYQQRRDYNNNAQNQDKNSQKKAQQKQGLNESTFKPDFQKKNNFYQNNNRQSNYQDNRNRNFNDRDRGGYRGNNYGGNNYNRPYHQNVKTVQVQKIVEKIVQVQKEVIVQKIIEMPRPIGRRVQPSVSIFVKGCRLTLTCSRLQKFEADLLVIPYKTLKLQLYPGSWVNSCEVNYKEKIKSKGQILEKEGSVYMQKCIGISKFKAFSFIKIGDPDNSITTGIKSLLKTLDSIVSESSISPSSISLSSKTSSQSGYRFKSVIFPICQKLGSSKTVIKTFIEQIQKYASFLKDVYISTEQPKTFCEAVGKFNQVFEELFEDNEISIN